MDVWRLGTDRRLEDRLIQMQLILPIQQSHLEAYQFDEHRENLITCLRLQMNYDLKISAVKE
jgi:hypothetical protein